MGEPENDEEMVLADPDSLLGLLQRGRGKGFLMALETPPEEVRALLLECIMNDPRLDKQCEPRGEYYASLILRTGMDLELLESRLKQEDNRRDERGWKTDFVLETLECLARRGSNQALKVLRDYIRYGSDWVWVTGVLSDLRAPGAMAGIGEILYDRLSSDPDLYEQLQDEIEEDWAEYCRMDEEYRGRCRLVLPICEPWKGLCEKNESLARFFSRNGLPYDPPPAVPRVTATDLKGLSVEDLLSSVDKASFFPSRRVLVEKVSAEDEDRLVQSLSSDDEYRVRLALRGLGELATPRAFEAVKSHIEDSEDARSIVLWNAFDALEEMPASRTLETARQWFSREEWRLQVAASRIFEHHATREDVPLLTQSLRTPEFLRDEDCRLGCALRALARFENLGRIPELEQIFCETGDSFRRGDAAEAMAATAPDHFAAEYAFECLWDCYWGALKVGCAMVDVTKPGALDRLREIAADPHECDDIRQVARERSEGVVG